MTCFRWVPRLLTKPVLCCMCVCTLVSLFVCLLITTCPANSWSARVRPCVRVCVWRAPLGVVSILSLVDFCYSVCVFVCWWGRAGKGETDCSGLEWRRHEPANPGNRKQSYSSATYARPHVLCLQCPPIPGKTFCIPFMASVAERSNTD